MDESTHRKLSLHVQLEALGGNLSILTAAAEEPDLDLGIRELLILRAEDMIAAGVRILKEFSKR